MIKEIKKPESCKDLIHDECLFYHDLISNEFYFAKSFDSNEKVYFNLKGKWHRETGPTYTNKFGNYYWLNDKRVSIELFSNRTKHLICRICEDFCNQKCFI